MQSTAGVHPRLGESQHIGSEPYLEDHTDGNSSSRTRDSDCDERP